MAGAQKRAGDFTGIQAEKDKAANAKELELTAQRMSLLNAVQVQQDNEVEDLMGELQRENQTRKYLAEELGEEGLVGFEEVDAKETPGRPSSKVRTTTVQPGQPGVGSIQNDGTMTYGNEIIKTNSTQVLGTGIETPGNDPGAAKGSERTRGRVDTLGDSINANPNNARRGLSWNEVEEVGGPVNDDEVPVVIRAKETLENVTIGVGNNYNFVEGKQYRVPKRVADHLEEKGLVWH